MDGYVKIGTELDTDEFDIKYQKLQRDVEKKELNVKVEVDKSNQLKDKLDIVKRSLKETKEELGEISADAERFAYLNSKSLMDLTQKESDELLELSFKEVDKQEEQLINKIIELESQQSEVNNKLAQQNSKIEEANFKLKESKQKFEDYKKSINTTDFSKIKRGIDEAGNSTSRLIKKVGQWALAVFGIRSAYMLVRQAMSTLSEYNEDLANKISNIRLVLATALEPVVLRIISLVSTLLSYLNYLMKALFGIDLYARAGELTTNKMAKDLASGSKSAKEMKKQLASFDEMNVVQDNTASGGGGAGGGAKTPEFNLPEAEIPEWLKWIVANKDIILATLAGIASAILAIKLGASLLMALGIGVLIAGIVYAVMNLIKYLKDPTFENFGKVIIGIGVALLGLAIIIGNIPLAIVAVAVIIVGVITKYWDKIKSFFQEKIIGWFDKKRKDVYDKFGAFGLAIFNTAENILILIFNLFDGQIKALKKIFDGLIQFITGVFTGNWKKALEGLKKIFSGVWEGLKSIVTSVWNFIKATVSNMASATAQAFSSIIKGAINLLFGFIENFINKFIRDINSVIGLINKIPGVSLNKLSTVHITRLAKGGIINQPGRGVPVGSAVAGERGQEGVIPLTNAQQMALLGEAIGKYITINAVINNSMNGRVISRELQKIQNESNFAFNS